MFSKDEKNVTSSRHTCKDVEDEGHSYNEPEAQEGYYIAYYFVRTSKICMQSLFKEVKSIPHIGDLGGISTWITRRTGHY